MYSQFMMHGQRNIKLYVDLSSVRLRSGYKIARGITRG